MAKFTPWIRSGIDSTAPQEPEGGEVEGAGGGLSTIQFLTKDIFGRYRNRQFVRPIGVALADSDLRNLSYWARWRIDSIFGPGRFDGMAMAPDDDWSPKNVVNGSSSLDSLIYALALAGYRGISVNIESDTLNTAASENPVGLSMSPRFVSNLYGDRTGFGFVGYTRLNNTGTQSAFRPAGGHSDILTMAVCIRRLWMSAYAGYWDFPDKEPYTRNGRLQDYTTPALTYPYADIGLDEPGAVSVKGPTSPKADIRQPVNILRLSMAGLGAGVTGAGAPTRPSYYAAKSLTNMVRTLNYLAGRPIAQIVYPQDLGPNDLR